MRGNMKSMMKAAVFSVLALGVVSWSGGTGFTQGKPIVVVLGNISSDTTWTNDNQYVLSGAVFVDAGATLTIQPGTKIFGESATNGTLIISRDAKIMAEGTAEAPIVFTSDQAVGQRARSDWGGLIVNGQTGNDTLIVDNGVDGLFGMPEGVVFYGGDANADAGTDEVNVTGGSATTGRYAVGPGGEDGTLVPVR